VNSLNDDMGDTCNITLRQILTNASSGAVINFASSLLPGGNDTIPTIHLTSALPPLKTGMVVSANCLTVTIGGVTRGKPSVAIDGAGAGTTSGFTQDAASTGGNTINGLAITGFTGYGIDLSKPGNTITCNYIGTVDGTTAKANTLGGIKISANAGGAGDNNIGADSPASATSGNLISGNGGPGIQASVLSGTAVKNNLFHNYIGYAADGTTRLANGTTSDIIVNNGGHIVLKQGNKVRK
jgi:hypothetical protein